MCVCVCVCIYTINIGYDYYAVARTVRVNNTMQINNKQTKPVVAVGGKQTKTSGVRRWSCCVTQ